jgi:hypothetical protein
MTEPAAAAQNAHELVAAADEGNDADGENDEEE